MPSLELQQVVYPFTYTTRTRRKTKGHGKMCHQAITWHGNTGIKQAFSHTIIWSAPMGNKYTSASVLPLCLFSVCREQYSLLVPYVTTTFAKAVLVKLFTSHPCRSLLQPPKSVKANCKLEFGTTYTLTYNTSPSNPFLSGGSKGEADWAGVEWLTLSFALWNMPILVNGTSWSVNASKTTLFPIIN